MSHPKTSSDITVASRLFSCPSRRALTKPTIIGKNIKSMIPENFRNPDQFIRADTSIIDETYVTPNHIGMAAVSRM